MVCPSKSQSTPFASFFFAGLGELLGLFIDVEERGLNTGREDDLVGESALLLVPQFHDTRR